MSVGHLRLSILTLYENVKSTRLGGCTLLPSFQSFEKTLLRIFFFFFGKFTAFSVFFISGNHMHQDSEVKKEESFFFKNFLLNSMGREAWSATVCGVSESDTTE